MVLSQAQLIYQQNMFERGVIVRYVVADDDYPMKVKIRHSYTELMEK